MRHRFIECPIVQPGDKIGIFQSRSPGSIPYEFNVRDGVSQMDASSLVGISLDEVVILNTLVFPHLYAMEVYYDTGKIPNKNGC